MVQTNYIQLVNNKHVNTTNMSTTHKTSEQVNNTTKNKSTKKKETTLIQARHTSTSEERALVSVSKNCKSPGVLFRTRILECGWSTNPDHTPSSLGAATKALLNPPNVPSTSEFSPDTSCITSHTHMACSHTHITCGVKTALDCEYHYSAERQQNRCRPHYRKLW